MRQEEDFVSLARSKGSKSTLGRLADDKENISELV